MKKTILLSLAVLLTTIFNYSVAKTRIESLKAGEPRHIATLIINVNATIVLIDNERANLAVTGKSSLRDVVTFTEMGDTLVIDASKKRNFRGAGVIYVPARQLKNVRINSDAHVTSYLPLQNPKLDVVINGACTFNIASVGKVNVTTTPFYSVEQTTEIHRLSESVLQKLDRYY